MGICAVYQYEQPLILFFNLFLMAFEQECISRIYDTVRHNVKKYNKNQGFSKLLGP